MVKGHNTARVEEASGRSTPRHQSNDQRASKLETSWSPTPRANSQFNASRLSTYRDVDKEDAYLPDRKPTVHESACANFIGVKEQRPVELLKMELQNTIPARKTFYSGLDNYPDMIIENELNESEH